MTEIMSEKAEILSELPEDLRDSYESAFERAEEALNRVNTMLNFEDRGWIDMFSGAISDGDITGPDLELAQSTSALSREMSVGAPLVSRGLDLRQSYVWSKGIVITGAPQPGGDKVKRGPKGKKEKFFADGRIQRYLLSSDAHRDMEDAAFNDGHFMFLGDDKERTGHPIPFHEIDRILLDPDYEGEVIAYRRNYKQSTSFGERKQRIVWYYVDTYTDARKHPQPGSKESDVEIELDKTKTLFVKAFNTKIGWPVGLPDSLAGLKHARIYAEMMNDGRIVSKANSKFANKVKSTNTNTAKDTAAKISKAQGVGNSAVMGKENELISIPQANRAYDFNGLRPVAAQVATAFNVSVVHLLSDPGAAGSSYGSASNLDLPTKRAMVARQREWVGFLERVLRWGTGEDLTVAFPSLDDPDPYREGQLVTMLWGTGVIQPDEMRERSLEIGGFTPNPEKGLPKGVLMPNNKASEKPAAVPSAASPDQGKSNGTGGVSNAASKDLQKESLDMSEMKDMIKELSQQIEVLYQRQLNNGTAN